MSEPAREIANVIEIRPARPLVSSLKIAEIFERRHDSVLRAIKNLQEAIPHLRIAAEMSPDERGRNRPVFWLNEEAALTLMPFVGGKRAIDGQRKLVQAYLYYRDAFKDPPRADLIRTKRDANKLLTDALFEARDEAGKTTDAHHYSNEAKLCNWVVCGSFSSIDEKSLSNEQVDLLRLVRERDAAFILAGLDYATRKQRLSAFAMRARTKLLVSGGAHATALC